MAGADPEYPDKVRIAGKGVFPLHMLVLSAYRQCQPNRAMIGAEDIIIDKGIL
jgi:hypothetical protein